MRLQAPTAAPETQRKAALRDATDEPAQHSLQAGTKKESEHDLFYGNSGLRNHGSGSMGAGSGRCCLGDMALRALSAASSGRLALQQQQETLETCKTNGNPQKPRNIIPLARYSFVVLWPDSLFLRNFEKGNCCSDHCKTTKTLALE